MIPRYQDDTRITEEAADWLVRLDADDSPECRAEFFAWMQQSAGHIREFLFVTEEFRRLDGMDKQRGIDVAALLDDTTANVVPLQERVATDLPRKPRNGPRIALAASLLAALGSIAALWFLPGGTQTYATAIGEQRSFKLADGSVLHMNAGSRAEVAFSSRERDVRLVDGEALFVVARDSARPFRVMTDTATIQAVGTQFNVYRHGTGTTVSVLEGAVRVVGQEKPVSAGEAIEVARNGRLTQNPAPDLARAVAWRQRRLVFRDDPLADVAAQFNRYNTRQIHVEDAAAQAKRLIGIFNADDPESLLLFLERDAALSIERRDDELIIRSR